MTSRSAFVIAAFAALTGCRSRETPAPTPAAPVAPPPVAARPLPTLFPDTPGMPAPLAALKFGMARTAVEEAVPALAGEHALAPEEHPGVQLRAHYDVSEQTLRYVEVELPAAREALNGRWGLPRAVKADGRRPALAWLAGDGQIQALLEEGEGGDRLALWPVTTPKALVELLPGRLGQPLDDANAPAGWQARPSEAGPRAQLPPFEFTTRPLIVRAETDAEGKVQTLRVQLAAETHPSVTAELLAALTARFGAPSEKPEEALGLRPVHYAADGLEATLERPVPAALTLRVSRTGPAAPAAPNP